MKIFGKQGGFIVFGMGSKTASSPVSGGLTAMIIMIILILITAVALMLTSRRQTY